jgi:hypothetical protein
MTQYVVRSQSSNWFWCGLNRWSASLTKAVRFNSHTEADLAALTYLPDPVNTWRVEPVPSVAGL